MSFTYVLLVVLHSIKLTSSPQMTFALCLQMPNHIRFKRPVDIWANFVPQMIFLQSIFGYLVLCILYKWSVDWAAISKQPPALLTMLISMFLSPGAIEPEQQLYPGQGQIQLILLAVAGICVPWMLCVKPYIQYKEMKKIQGQGYVGLGHDNGPRHTADDALEGEEEGNGAAIAEEMEEDHVRPSARGLLDCGDRVDGSSGRSTTTLAKSSSIRSSIRSSSVWGAFRIRRHTCASGRCRSLTPSSPRCYGA